MTGISLKKDKNSMSSLEWTKRLKILCLPKGDLNNMNRIKLHKNIKQIKRKFKKISMWTLRITLLPIWIGCLLNEKYKLNEKTKRNKRYREKKIKKLLIKSIENYFIKNKNDKYVYISDYYIYGFEDCDTYKIDHLFRYWGNFKAHKYLSNYSLYTKVDYEYWFNWLKDLKSKTFEIVECDTSKKHYEDEDISIPSYALTVNGKYPPRRLLKIVMKGE